MCAFAGCCEVVPLPPHRRGPDVPFGGVGSEREVERTAPERHEARPRQPVAAGTTEATRLLALQSAAGNAAVVVLLGLSSTTVRREADTVRRTKGGGPKASTSKAKAKASGKATPTVPTTGQVVVAPPHLPPARYDTEPFVKGRRVAEVEGPAIVRGTAGRGATPAPASGALPFGFDGGHVLGLELGGENISENVVPMLPRFNRGAWRNVERTVKDDAIASTGRHPWIEIRVGYATPADDVPKTLDVALTRDKEPPAFGQPSPGRETHRYPTASQPGDIPRTRDADPKTAALLTDAADRAHGADGDLYEQAAKAYFSHTGDADRADVIRDTRHMPESKGASYPDDWRKRPYEHLDILCLAGELDANTTFGDRVEFSGRQRELILQANKARRGCLVSDAGNDPQPSLDERGAANAPEVDHIVPKVSGGGNFFSNARVVSWALNNTLERVKGLPGLVDVKRLKWPAFPTTGNLEMRMTELLPEIAARFGGGFTLDDVHGVLDTHYPAVTRTEKLDAAVTRALDAMVKKGQLTIDGTRYGLPSAAKAATPG